MALTKVNRRWAALISQFLVFVVTMSLTDVLISDGSVVSALALSVCTAVLALGSMWWLTRRAHH
jgi:hypothetical protein